MARAQKSLQSRSVPYVWSGRQRKSHCWGHVVADLRQTPRTTLRAHTRHFRIKIKNLRRTIALSIFLRIPATNEKARPEEATRSLKVAKSCYQSRNYQIQNQIHKTVFFFKFKIKIKLKFINCRICHVIWRSVSYHIGLIE